MVCVESNWKPHRGKLSAPHQTLCAAVLCGLWRESCNWALQTLVRFCLALCTEALLCEDGQRNGGPWLRPVKTPLPPPYSGKVEWLKTLFSSLTQFLASSAPIPSLSTSFSPWSIKWQKLSVQAFLAPWAVSSVRCPCSALLCPHLCPCASLHGHFHPGPPSVVWLGENTTTGILCLIVVAEALFTTLPAPTSFALGRKKAVLCYSNKRNYLLCVEKCYVSEEAEPKETARISESILSATAKLDS